jgi:hypothetical protein
LLGRHDWFVELGFDVELKIGEKVAESTNLAKLLTTFSRWAKFIVEKANQKLVPIWW